MDIPNERTITITLTSHVSDEAWASMVAEISEEVEQIACMYAAAASNDTYVVHIAATAAIEIDPASLITVSEPDDDDSRWTVSGDLRAPGTGVADPANYAARDALQALFPAVEFDPETSCFFAYAPNGEMADRLVAAIIEWLTNRWTPSS